MKIFNFRLSAFAFLILFALFCTTAKADCVTPVDDLLINESTILCPGMYVINDTAQDGVIKMNAENITLTCNGTTIKSIVSPSEDPYCSTLSFLDCEGGDPPSCEWDPYSGTCDVRLNTLVGIGINNLKYNNTINGCNLVNYYSNINLSHTNFATLQNFSSINTTYVIFSNATNLSINGSLFSRGDFSVLYNPPSNNISVTNSRFDRGVFNIPSNNSFIFNNTFTYTAVRIGGYDYYSENIVFLNNNITNMAIYREIYFRGNNNLICNNIFEKINSTSTIDFFATNSTFCNNTINSTFYGLSVPGTNNVISNCSINGGNYALYSTAKNITIVNSTITSSDHAVYLNVNSTYIVNSTLQSGSSNKDIIMDQGNFTTIFNTNFNSSKVNISTGNMTVKWYAKVNVTDQESTPVKNANVSIYENSTGSWEIEGTGLTNDEGLAFVEATEGIAKVGYSGGTLNTTYLHNVTILYPYENSTVTQVNQTGVTAFTIYRPYPSCSNATISSTASGSMANFSLIWSDVNEMSGFIFSTNSTGRWENSSWVPFSGRNTSYYVIMLNTTQGTFLQGKFYANNSLGAWATYMYNLTTDIIPAVTIQTVSDYAPQLMVSATELVNGENAVFKFTSALQVRQVNISLSSDVSRLSIIVSSVENASADAPQGVTTYAYLKIEKNVNDSQIGGATIDFAVSKSWLEDNGISSANVSMYRLVNGTWTELSTYLVSEDTDNVYYRAQTPGFSYFMIGTKAALESECTEVWSCTDWSKCTDGIQTRTCTGNNDCNMETGKPIEQRLCASEDNMARYAITGALVGITLLLFSLPRLRHSRKRSRR